MLLLNFVICASALLLLQFSAVSAFPHPAANLAVLDRRAISTPTSSKPSTQVLSCPTPTVPLGGGGSFATRQGRLFQIQSKTQFFAGTNAWWLGHLQSNSDVDNVLSEMALSQLKVARVWGFGNINDASNPSYDVYYQVLNSSGVFLNCNANTGIPRLDYVVSAAEAKGVKLVLPLLNNYDDLGGINTYTTAFGGNHTTFYTDAKSQAAYKAYIAFIVNRYKSSPAIFAWELANEARCSGCSTSVIFNWASTISAYIKSLDSKHMVTLGDEGWLAPTPTDSSYAYSGYEGVDFAKNMAISTLDYGTFHLYPEDWGYGADPLGFGNTWIANHNAIGRQTGKPVVLEEYGSTNASDKTARMKPWQQLMLANTSVAYDSFWQFATPLSINPYDDYALYYNKTAGSDYDTLVTKHAAAMLAKSPVANH